MRRYLIIAAGAIVIIGIAVIVYFYFFANSAGVAVTPGGATLPSAGNSAATTGSTGATGTGAASVPATPTQVTSRLVRIDTGPVVAGEAAVDVNLLPDGTIATSTKAASTTPDVAIKYLERESGNVFSYLVGKSSLTRVSNKTLPGIEEADWLADGSAAFVRYLSGADFSTINTYALPASGIGGFFLPQNLTGVSIGASSLLTLASGANGTLANTLHPDGSASKQAFSSPLTMLRASFAGTTSYLAYTKPSAGLPGYAYLVDAAGNFSRIAGPLNGLVALASPKGTWILVSYSTNGVMSMELVNAKTRASVPLPVATIADKCAWTADESAVYCGVPTNPSTSYAYPDDWYQGAISFNDRIWKIDVTGRLAQLTLDFSAATKQQLDAQALSIDRLSKELVFVNKIDGSLWAYQL